ncbi:MAG TPA: SDR family NAD(P)-dependent oxidoreductase [Dehalococcoidia bacterium]
MSGAVLVTGAAGFIGSHLVERLLAQGRPVVCLDSFDEHYDRRQKEANLQEALGGRPVPVLEGDVRDGALLRRVLEEHRVETVVHLAARPGVRPSLEDPRPYVEINVAGTVAVLEACRAAGVRRLLFASSSSVYGESGGLPVPERAPLRPLSPYAASKAAAEQFCSTYASLYGISVVALRFFTVYGPRQRPDMAIRRFTELIDAGREIEVYGDGSSRRDFTYISDVVDGVAACLDLPAGGFQAFNLGGARPVELLHLIDVIQRHLGKEARVRFRPARAGEPATTFADITRAARVLGFRPRVEVEEGVRRFVEWYRARSLPEGKDAAATVS